MEYALVGAGSLFKASQGPRETMAVREVMPTTFPETNMETQKKGL